MFSLQKCLFNNFSLFFKLLRKEIFWMCLFVGLHSRLYCLVKSDLVFTLLSLCCLHMTWNCFRHSRMVLKNKYCCYISAYTIGWLEWVHHKPITHNTPQDYLWSVPLGKMVQGNQTGFCLQPKRTIPPRWGQSYKTAKCC